jgi:two-component system, cell cycle sensor histidine kinase and response regulator CckA
MTDTSPDPRDFTFGRGTPVAQSSSLEASGGTAAADESGEAGESGEKAENRESCESRESTVARWLDATERLAGLGVWELSLPGLELTLSPHVYELLDLHPSMFGTSADEVRKRVHPEDREGLRASVQAAILDGTDIRIDHRIIRRDGSVRTMHVRGELMLNASGEPERMVGTLQDVTEQRALEWQLRQAQRAETIGSMAAGLAHDFNNLLTVINGHTSLLLGSTPRDGSRTHLEAIELATTRAAQLTAQLLAYSKRDLATPLDISIGTALTTICRMLGQALDERIQFELEIVDDSAIRVDPGQLDQVIVNLVVNARDAMPNGGTIRLRATQVTLRSEAAALDVPPGEYCVVEVHDSGVGMDRETLERIFDPFFTTKSSGTGLGLPTVFGIVRQSGGAIRFSSAPGLGTTARVFLPAVGAAPTSSSVTRRNEPTRHGAHIVVADDDESVRALVLLVLEDAGFRTTGVSTVEQALSAVLGGDVDALLTDINLGTESGLDLVSAVREGYPDMPVIVMSGYQEPEELHRATFLPKPFTTNDLLRVATSAVQGRR